MKKILVLLILGFLTFTLSVNAQEQTGIPTPDPCYVQSTIFNFDLESMPSWPLSKEISHRWIRLYDGPQLAYLAEEKGAIVQGTAGAIIWFDENSCIQQHTFLQGVTLTYGNTVDEYIAIAEGIFISVSQFSSGFVSTNATIELENPELGFSGFDMNPDWIKQNSELTDHPVWMTSGFAEWPIEEVPPGLETYEMALSERDMAAPVYVGIFMSGDHDYPVLVTYTDSGPLFRLYLGHGLFMPISMTDTSQSSANL